MKIRSPVLALRPLQRRDRWLSGLVLLLLLLILVACEGLPDLPALPGGVGATATEASATATVPVVSTPAESSPVPEETPEQAAGVRLKIWMPPQFDPDAGTPAGELLKARLEQFQAENPHVTLEVRLKAVTGAGGLLESLRAASTAAPLAVPDLIVLSQPLLESAVLEGLIHPFDGLTTAVDDHEWYEYARQLGRLQDSAFGLPFAGDALVMAYRPLLVETPPVDWETTATISGTLAFPAADPQALFTLLQYQAAGGAVQDDQGAPMLEERYLVDVLSFYQAAEQAGAMPFWLTQFENFDQVWESFGGRQSSMAAGWFSSYHSRNESLPINPQLAVLPAPGGRAYTLATGWVWAIASARPDRHELSARLAEYLLEDGFLGEWASAAGYLPPHSGALASWQEQRMRTLVNQVQLSAHLLPPGEIIASIGPVLQKATVDVLKEQADPAGAAKTALESLENQ